MNKINTYSVRFLNSSTDVLVAPIRVCKRLFELTVEEVGDLFRVVQNVQYVIESVYKTTSTTIVVQDGPLAGQTIQV